MQRKGRGANQFGRYVWQPGDKYRTEAKFAARVTPRKGLSVRANCDTIDELVSSLKEALERLAPLVPIEGEKDAEED